MKELVKKICNFTSLFLMIGSTHAQASNQCTFVPANDLSSSVYACESLEEYIFGINGESLSYNKQMYQKDLSRYISKWIKDVESPAHFQNAKVDIWLSAPELNPSATQMRAVVSTHRKKFVVFLSIRPNEWSSESYNIGILSHRDSYPQTYGIKATSILVKKQEGASKEEFLSILTKNDLTEITNFSGDWYQATTKAFSEASAVKKITNSKKAQQYVEKIQTNAVVEWIALREMVFSFRLKSE